eukprot:gene16913-biopygen2282
MVGTSPSPPPPPPGRPPSLLGIPWIVERSAPPPRLQRLLWEKRPRPRPARVRFFEFCRAPRVRSASGLRPLPFLPRF